MLSPSMLRRFIGGQMKIQNQVGRWIRCGEIRALVFEGDIVTFEFKWVAKSPLPHMTWVNDPETTYSVSKEGSTVSDMGDGRIFISAHRGDSAVLFPPGVGTFNPTSVPGLQFH